MKENINIEEILKETDSKRKLPLFIFLISLSFILIGLGFVLQNKININRLNLKLFIEDIYLYFIIYLFIPGFYFFREKKDSIKKYLFNFLIIFLGGYLMKLKEVSEFFAFIYFFNLVLVITFLSKVKSLGFDFKYINNGLKYGFVTAFFLSLHLIYILNLTKNYRMEIFPLNFYVYWLFYNLGVSSLGEEIFYRGFLFKQLEKFNFEFWWAAIISTMFYALIHSIIFVPSLKMTFALVFFTMFYKFLQGITSCFIFKKSESLFSCIIFNTIFSMVCNSIK